MSAPRTHACPGGCGTQVDDDRLACKPCWFRLPRWYQGAVSAAWRRRGRHPNDPGAARAHQAAVGRAMQWYRDNPRAEP